MNERDGAINSKLIILYKNSLYSRIYLRVLKTEILNTVVIKVIVFYHPSNLY